MQTWLFSSLGRFESSGDGVRQGAAGAFAAVEFFNGGFEIGGGKVRPAFLQEDEFGEGALPKEKVGEALFAAGANEQIDLRRAAAVDFREDVAEGLRREFG